MVHSEMPDNQVSGVTDDPWMKSKVQIIHDPYHCCWRPGHARSQDNSSNGIGLVFSGIFQCQYQKGLRRWFVSVLYSFTEPSSFPAKVAMCSQKQDCHKCCWFCIWQMKTLLSQPCWEQPAFLLVCQHSQKSTLSQRWVTINLIERNACTSW